MVGDNTAAKHYWLQAAAASPEIGGGGGGGGILKGQFDDIPFRTSPQIFAIAFYVNKKNVKEKRVLFWSAYAHKRHTQNNNKRAEKEREREREITIIFVALTWCFSSFLVQPRETCTTAPRINDILLNRRLSSLDFTVFGRETPARNCGQKSKMCQYYYYSKYQYVKFGILCHVQEVRYCNINRRMPFRFTHLHRWSKRVRERENRAGRKCMKGLTTEKQVRFTTHLVNGVILTTKHSVHICLVCTEQKSKRIYWNQSFMYEQWHHPLYNPAIL